MLYFTLSGNHHIKGRYWRKSTRTIRPVCSIWRRSLTPKMKSTKWNTKKKTNTKGQRRVSPSTRIPSGDEWSPGRFLSLGVSTLTPPSFPFSLSLVLFLFFFLSPSSSLLFRVFFHPLFTSSFPILSFFSLSSSFFYLFFFFFSNSSTSSLNIPLLLYIFLFFFSLYPFLRKSNSSSSPKDTNKVSPQTDRHRHSSPKTADSL